MEVKSETSSWTRFQVEGFRTGRATYLDTKYFVIYGKPKGRSYYYITLRGIGVVVFLLASYVEVGWDDGFIT